MRREGGETGRCRWSARPSPPLSPSGRVFFPALVSSWGIRPPAHPTAARQTVRLSDISTGPGARAAAARGRRGVAAFPPQKRGFCFFWLFPLEPVGAGRADGQRGAGQATGQACGRPAGGAGGSKGWAPRPATPRAGASDEASKKKSRRQGAGARKQRGRQTQAARAPGAAGTGPGPPACTPSLDSRQQATIAGACARASPPPLSPPPPLLLPFAPRPPSARPGFGAGTRSRRPPPPARPHPGRGRSPRRARP